MDYTNDERAWRSYAAWGSLLCGILGLVFTIALAAYIDFGNNHPFNPWEARYFFVVAPLSLIGVILGAIGKDSPRILGLVLSACILLRVLGATVSM